MAKTKTWTYEGRTVEASSMKEAAKLLGVTGYALWNATHPKSGETRAPVAKKAPATKKTSPAPPMPPAPPADADDLISVEEWNGLKKGDAVKFDGHPRGHYEFRRYVKSPTQEYVEIHGGSGGKLKTRPVRPEQVHPIKARARRGRAS